VNELARYKDLVGLREKDVDSLKKDLRRLQQQNEELRRHIDSLDRENKDLKSILSTQPGQRGLEELSYHQNLESQTTDARGAKFYNGNVTSTTSGGGMSNSSTGKQSQAERSAELMRLKKEYNQLVKRELSKMQKERDFYTEAHSRSPERSGTSHNSSFL